VSVCVSGYVCVCRLDNYHDEKEKKAGYGGGGGDLRFCRECEEFKDLS